jgi:hypothetical protein
MQGVKGEAVRLRRTLENAADAVSSAFPKGKQHGCFSGYHSLCIPKEYSKRPQRKAIVAFFEHFAMLFMQL